MSKKYRFSLSWELQKTFTVLAEAISQSAGWFQTLKVPKIKMIISAYLFVASIIGTVLRVKRIKFTISKTLLKQNLPMTAYVKRIKFSVISKLTYSLTQTLYVKKIVLTGIGKLRTKLPNIIVKVKPIKVSGTPMVGTFTTLAYYDTEYADGYLNSMSGSTLLALEYTAS